LLHNSAATSLDAGRFPIEDTETSRRSTASLPRKFRSTSASRSTAAFHRTDIEVYLGYEEAWRELFPALPPLAVAQTAGLPIEDDLIEIDLIAAMP
jgi:hypothetical protein